MSKYEEKSQGQINDEAILAALGYKQGKALVFEKVTDDKSLKSDLD